MCRVMKNMIVTKINHIKPIVIVMEINDPICILLVFWIISLDRVDRLGATLGLTVFLQSVIDIHVYVRVLTAL